ncbi:MAG: hypothetical protein ACO1RT_15150 [Planctomycetaceae bacterium]
MRTRVLQTTLLVIGLLATTSATLVAAPPGLLKIFGKDPQAERPKNARQLSEVDGPWMILAASFAGHEGKQQAQALADELSQDYGLPTFIHEEDFDFGGKLNLVSPDGRTARYANQAQYQAYAVLVGEYDSVDHPQLIKDLKRLKAAKPKSLNGEGVSTAKEDNPLVAVQKLQQNLLKRTGKTDVGPLGNAFATTNPMLPEEFFSAPEVDSFVMELNSQVEHSLLENPGRYTVVVRTFSGLGTIVDGKRDKEFEPSSERMDSCATNADKMVRELRKNGVEAYQFHDRTRSLVTVGSFSTLGRQLPGGGFEYDAAIRQTMQTYCAGNQAEPTQFGPGIAANHIASIPYDVQPTPIAVPKKSKRSLYIGKLGMR